MIISNDTKKVTDWYNEQPKISILMNSPYISDEGVISSNNWIIKKSVNFIKHSNSAIVYNGDDTYNGYISLNIICNALQTPTTLSLYKQNSIGSEKLFTKKYYVNTSTITLPTFRLNNVQKNDLIFFIDENKTLNQMVFAQINIDVF